jgi:subtilase family serine protease
MTCKARSLWSAFALLALFLSSSVTICAAAENGFSAIAGSFTQTTDIDTGGFSSSRMSVEVVLTPRNQSQLDSLLADVYDAKSANYHRWLGQGEFESRFAPDPAQIAAVTDYLRESGLDIEESSSPFLLRVSGPSYMIEKTFKTSIHTYQNRKGITYYSNASEVQMPEGLASAVFGVVGLSSTVRSRAHHVRPARQTAPPVASCETPYPTAAEIFDAVNNGASFPFGYGGGPQCMGLTPSQTNSIYGAPNLGAAAKGAGVNLAVFELSAYQQSDIKVWTEQFYGPGFKPPLVDITVDGGPLAPICPAGDECPPEFEGYAGDVEVAADIEMSLEISPSAKHILVYNAPNDNTGQTVLDEYARIAKDNTADVISTSWGNCENDAGAALVQAENLIFEKMALQGQSMFGFSGDTGAFGCIRGSGTTIVNQADPSSQPWVTSVGGTSFESFNPDTNPFPDYPAGVETVWNVDDLCNQRANEGGSPGLFWCAETGAGGGGSSQFWGRPSYQSGPGITNNFTTYGNGTTHCALAAKGKPCREVPDVSANADEYTGYSVYCTGTAALPNSECAFPPFWFAIGGTSLSSPLWSAIIANHDSLYHTRIGNANPLLYELYNRDPNGYFNDITGIHQSTNNNGLFPTTPGYDLATGIGTPKMGALITLVPYF